MPGLLRDVALAVLALLVACPAVVRADGFALELGFGEGVTPCFTQDELMHAVVERLAHTSSANRANQPGLSIRAQVDQSQQQGLHAIITSRRNDADEEGRREIVADGGCAALLEPLSLVIALVVDLAGPDPVLAAETAPAMTAEPDASQETPEAPAPTADAQADAHAETAPAHEPDVRDTESARVADAMPALPAADPPAHAVRLGLDSRNALSATAGVGLGILPDTVGVLRFAARFALKVPARSDEHVPIVAELGADLLVPQQLEPSVSINGVAWHAAGCAFWHDAWGGVGFEPCAGFWLRVLGARSEGSSFAAFESRQFTLLGCSLGMSFYFPLGGPWSAFTTGQAQIPFATPTLRLRGRTIVVLPTGTPPYFNAGTAGSGPPPTVSVPAPGTLELFETRPLAATLLAGIAVSL